MQSQTQALLSAEEAAKIVKKTFDKKPFNYDQFFEFCRFLPKIDLKNDKDFKVVKESFRQNVKSWKRIGRIKDQDQIIDVLAVKMKDQHSLEFARTTQRNFIAGYLDGEHGSKTSKDAALVAFYFEENQDWRLSLVEKNYVYNQENNQIETKISQAKRHSFLLGENEGSNTICQNFKTFLSNSNQSLTALKQVFDVEKVSKEFFTAYKALYLNLEETISQFLSTNQAIQDQFLSKNIDSSNFAKKLLGQIVFIYFLQKKGWLGVKKSDSNLNNWGSGDKNFLQNLFQKKYKNYDNFFNEILQPLFYQALAQKRNNDYYLNFDCLIPFLNGGLFEPLNGYNWQENKILLNNSLFEDIFTVFNLYNFTVYEEQPLEKEVAVDPEMLGKVFENLLEIKDRKSTGAFYTPRKIVHYMCKESLIEFIFSHFAQKIPLDEIETLVYQSENLLENEKTASERTQNPNYGGKYQNKIGQNIIKNSQAIDLALQNIKICDPAVGSGAFLVAMINEIVAIRLILNNFENAKSQNQSNQTSQNQQQNTYFFKREIILNSIYATDIEASAIEIAKLRLWLCLIVDENNFENITPLPNLDFKIMQGDSLVEDFEGIKLFNQKLIFDNINFLANQIKKLEESRKALQIPYFEAADEGNLKLAKLLKQQIDEIDKNIKNLKQPENPNPETEERLFAEQNQSYRTKERLKQLSEDFFQESNHDQKQKLKLAIEETQWQLIAQTLKEQCKNEAEIAKINQVFKSNQKPFFLWQLNFAEVFEEQGQKKAGFDIVIGNPPYIQLQELKNNPLQAIYKNQKFQTHDANGDIYCLFYEKGIQLLKTNGILCFITSNKWMRAGYGEKLRGFLSQQNPIKLIDLGGGVFETATVDTNILLITKEQNQNQLKALTISQGNQSKTKNNKSKKINQKTLQEQSEEAPTNINQKTPTMAEIFKENAIHLSNLGKNGWFIGNLAAQNLKTKIESLGTALKNWDVKIYRGVLTGLNEAFIINTQTKELLCKQDPKSIEILKPILRGRDIKKYGYSWAGLWVIATFPALKIDIDKYPAVKKHLLDFGKERLEQAGKKLTDGTSSRKKTGNKWFETQDQIAYYSEFEKEKVVWNRITNTISFSYCASDYFLLDSTFFITGISARLITGVLNSKLLQWWTKNTAATLGEGSYGAKIYIELSPIPQITQQNQAIIDSIENLVEQILALKKAENQQFENQNQLNPALKNAVANQKKQKPKKLEAVIQPEQTQLEGQIDQLVYQLYNLSPSEIELIEKS